MVRIGTVSGSPDAWCGRPATLIDMDGIPITENNSCVPGQFAVWLDPDAKDDNLRFKGAHGCDDTGHATVACFKSLNRCSKHKAHASLLELPLHELCHVTVEERHDMRGRLKQRCLESASDKCLSHLQPHIPASNNDGRAWPLAFEPIGKSQCFVE